MSGFFTLAGKDHHQEDDSNTNNNSSLYLFKNGNDEIYSKGFELWQHYYQMQQQRSHVVQPPPPQQNFQDVDFSVGPSNNNRRIISSSTSGSIGDDSSYRAPATGFRMMRGGGDSGGGATAHGAGMNCQDCGNQAKKDCPHMRCRTCCKSRGFHCQTHVKSTWVPAAKRRERQQQLAAMQHHNQHHLHHHQQQQQQQQNEQLQNLSLRGSDHHDHDHIPTKRPRENPGSSSLIRIPPSSTGLEVGHFPAELSSPAVFRCVKVSAIDDAEEQYAYQTAVNIGGHVFKGILYDQGVDRYGGAMAGHDGAGGSGSHHHHHQQQQPPLNLIGSSADAAAVTVAAAGSNPGLPMLDQSGYPLSAFMAGTQFFPPPRS